jgi:hypothetical protein
VEPDIFNSSAETLNRNIWIIEGHYETMDRDPDEIEYSWAATSIARAVNCPDLKGRASVLLHL